MEDGDDDISVTVHCQNEDEVPSPKNEVADIVITKCESKCLSSGSDYTVSSTKHDTEEGDQGNPTEGEGHVSSSEGEGNHTTTLEEDLLESQDEDDDEDLNDCDEHGFDITGEEDGESNFADQDDPDSPQYDLHLSIEDDVAMDLEEEEEGRESVYAEEDKEVQIGVQDEDGEVHAVSSEESDEGMQDSFIDSEDHGQELEESSKDLESMELSESDVHAVSNDDIQAGSGEESESNMQIVSEDGGCDIQTGSEEDGDQDVEMCLGTTSDPKVVEDDLHVPICSDEEENIHSPVEDTDSIHEKQEKEEEMRVSPIVQQISDDSECEYMPITTGDLENEADSDRCESVSSLHVPTEMTGMKTTARQTVESQKLVEVERSRSSSPSEGDCSKLPDYKEEHHSIEKMEGKSPTHTGEFEKEAQDNRISTSDIDISMEGDEHHSSDKPKLCSIPNNEAVSEACKGDEMKRHSGRDSVTLMRDNEEYISKTETGEKDISLIANNIQDGNEKQISDSILSPQCKEVQSGETKMQEIMATDHSDIQEKSKDMCVDEVHKESDFLKASSDEQCSSQQYSEHNYELEIGEKENECADGVDNENNYEDITTSTENQVNGELELEKNQLEQPVHTEEQTTHSREKSGVKRKREDSPMEESYTDILQTESTKESNHFKGFKKRYIAQVSGAAAKEVCSLAYQEQPRAKGNKSPAKKLIVEAPQIIVPHQVLPDGVPTNTPLTEYAQYLGLQPTVKFKCYKCGESGFPSMLKLKEHQNTCLKNFQIQPFSKPSPTRVEMSPSTNFRITRKVYLCSACGTYYENWNLFLHMREVHKRHTCLFCLSMFAQADQLADHLSSKHGVIDNSYNSPEHFLSEFKGSFFVMCCGCEQLFTERDHFFDHACGDTRIISADLACSLCGLKGAHFPTCRRAFTDSCPPSLGGQSTSVCIDSDITQNSHVNVPEKTLSHTKFGVSFEKSSTKKVYSKLAEQKTELGKKKDVLDIDDQYDISDAASYCHVNIGEPEKQNVASSKAKASTKGKTVERPLSPIEKTSTEELKQTDNNDDSEVKEMEIQETKDTLNSPTKIEEGLPDDGQSMQKAANHDTPVSGEQENGKETSDVPAEELLESKQSTSSVEMDSVPETKLSPKLSPKPNVAKETAVDADSDSETSESGADTHDSDRSSSSSDASSDENEQEDKTDKAEKPIKESGVSEESDAEKSDSDKMSIVVDEAPSDDVEEQTKKDNQDSEVKEATPVNDNENQEENKNMHSEDICGEGTEEKSTANDQSEEPSDNIQVAGDDVPLLELTLEEPFEALSIQTVVKECVKISSSACVYCNHAKRIAVNGKQLVLHLLAEHRFEAVVCSDSGELTSIDCFVDKMKGKLSDLQDMYFNTDTYDNTDRDSIRPFDRTYECFHCHFITTLHKELYLHNRKMHQKTILICIMCKSNFYSYSELLCHLCPGIYVPDSNILFRCCLCVVDGLPSAFRLMVHLRKRHHACDVCLETTGDQQKLSNHVWKHKLHHLCYRCGIAYRNKPDITKHLFWKHGTESVLCKKCLQKKWPHVYHFCIPPTAFLCEECNASFSRAVSLKVHKRLHAGDVPYSCDECDEKLISKKLLKRHKEIHNPNANVKDAEEKQVENIPVKEDVPESHMGDTDTNANTKKSDESSTEDLKAKTSRQEAEALKQVESLLRTSSASVPEQKKVAETLHKPDDADKKTKVVDVYDLPPLNLSSESDDSDDEATKKAPASNSKPAELKTDLQPDENVTSEVEKTSEVEEPVQIVDGVWDNFKTYKANLEKREGLHTQTSTDNQATADIVGLQAQTSTDNQATADIVGLQAQTSADNQAIVDVVMADHDYCVMPSKVSEFDSSQTSENPTIPQASDSKAENLDEDKNSALDADHNYCFNTSPRPEEKNDASLPPQAPSPPPPPHPSPPHPPTQLPQTTTPVTALSKKKQKSPKKKQKQSGSSSSSDSSSNSDSSSCTCGTNCSCTSSSSSSSGSSSSSSDSDSSSSEGRRRQAARRERRKERMKKKLDANSKETAVNASCEPAAEKHGAGPGQGDAAAASTGHTGGTATGAPPVSEETELLIHESDLDTTETETDEDFYDKFPQKQANKLLAEKRNQLLLLAAVAPVNNGTMAQPSPSTPETQEPIQKKKGKTKRHKKAQHNSSEKRVESKLKLNIPVSYYNNPSYSATTAVHSTLPVTNPQPQSGHASRLSHEPFSSCKPETSTPAYHSTGSGSETESKRLSKRKRRPKRFYGDSSDEESEQVTPQPYKWRKVTPLPATNSHTVTQATHNVSSGFAYRGSSSSSRIPTPEPVHSQTVQQEKSDEDEAGDESDSDADQKRSSSDSSDSDSDNEQSDADSDAETTANTTHAASTASGSSNQQKNENLYCYCQCPYDEVSEMIACDGKDCSIEWFHFECVGIMVPPKGKWFCPDCRKKTAVRSEYLLHA